MPMPETFYSSAISAVTVYPGAVLSDALTVTSATFAHGTLTLSSVLPNMGLGTRRLSRGTLFTCTGGTGATTGAYTVASSSNLTSFVLTATIGAGADGQTNITGTIAAGHPTITGTYADSIFGDGLSDGMIHSIQVETADSTARTLTIYDGLGHVCFSVAGIIYGGTATDVVPWRSFTFPEPLRAIKGFGVSVSDVALKVSIVFSRRRRFGA